MPPQVDSLLRGAGQGDLMGSSVTSPGARDAAAIRPPRFWRIGAPVFVGGFVASLVAGSVLVPVSLFLPAAGAAELRTYYTQGTLGVAVAAVLQLVAAGGLVRFGTGLAIASGGGRRVRSSTWLSAGAFALSSLLSLLLDGLAAGAADSTLLVLARLTLVLGGPVHLAGMAGTLWFASRDGLAAGRGPRVVLRAGTVIGPLLLVSLLSMAIPPVTRVEPLWRLLAVVWLLSIACSGVRPAAQEAAAERLP